MKRGQTTSKEATMGDVNKDMKGFGGMKGGAKKGAGVGGEGKAAANPDRVDGAPRADITLPKAQRRCVRNRPSRSRAGPAVEQLLPTTG